MPPPSATDARRTAAIVGGGPAGLMAAEILSGRGVAVTLYDRMSSVGRKLLMAGRGGLNLTHGEPLAAFLGRYEAAAARLGPAIAAFAPDDLRRWADGLGAATFVGSSGRVFPAALKASPLLRAWLARLEAQGVAIVTRRRWIGWDETGAPRLAAPDGGLETVQAGATLLALGGASWPRLGSDGGWVAPFGAAGIAVTPLRPANCGFVVPWSDIFRSRFAGTPVKSIAASAAGQTSRGELVITGYGLEGGAIYALSAPLREAIAAEGAALLQLDLRPDLDAAALARRVAQVRPRESLANLLRRLGLPAVAGGLLREVSAAPPRDPAALAALLKAVPLRLTAPRPIERAISTAGGLAWDAIDDRFMLRARPGTFVAGEMIDWEAPTGGYLLQACFATGAAAAAGMLAWLDQGGDPAPPLAL